jgi:excinuclease UvrABC nuclease subunit
MLLPNSESPLRVPATSQGIMYENVKFSEPRRFPPLLIPPTHGLYAIMVVDTSYRPRPYRVLYIGETENFQERLTTGHEKYEDWKREAQGAALYYSYHWFHGTQDARLALEADLIRKLNPPCNVQLRSVLMPPPSFKPW